ncbi:MAG: hypothetical protein IRY98_03045 [Alicyclobacillaceae bacterium]|nr:hypothetical protein [Alicyclobacillaceae bacterium]
MRKLPAENVVAVVAEPLWLLDFRGWRPKYLIALLSLFPWNPGDPIQRSAEWLLGEADVVFAASEQIYLQTCFRRSGVFFLDPGESREIQAARFTEVIGRLTRTEPLEDLMAAQWQFRMEHCMTLLSRVETRETVHFLIAAYRYLLGEPEAKDHLLRSFELAVAAGRPDCLRTHYRFLSAMLAKENRVEEAVQVYGVTAVEEEERREYRLLRDWVAGGERELARARIFLLNDDVRSAWEVVRELSGEAARRLQVEAALKAGRLEEAYRRMAPRDLRTRAGRRDAEILAGLIGRMKGDRFGAVHHLLRAAAEDPDALVHLLELGVLEEALERLKRGEGAAPCGR